MNPDLKQPSTATGLILASFVIGGWATIHIYSVFFHALSAPLWQTVSLIALQCWLYAGMFIVAHDTMPVSYTHLTLPTKA